MLLKQSVWGASMKRLLFALVLVCAPASAGIHGYQFAPQYRADAPRIPAPVTGNYTGIRTVAVLSGLGDFELEMRSPAGKRISAMDVGPWQVDDRVEAAVRLTLKDRFRFVRVAYDRRWLAAARADLAHAGRYDAFLRSVPAQGIDAFVVVRPNAVGGLALQTIAHRDTILWADFVVDVIDARSLAVIASATARIQPPGGTRANFPGLVVGRDYTLDAALRVDNQHREDLRRLTDELLTATLSETLAAMGLGR
jgi:hypothetical protein